jgi:hypothetical protein
MPPDYGHHHRTTRQHWAPIVAAGHATCWRCGRPITPGTPWDLGHNDTDPTQYQGPEHTACNRAAGARRGNRLRGRRRARTTSRLDTSRAW